MKREFRKWMTEHGVTAVQIAEKAEIEEPREIWHILSGRKKPPQGTFEKLHDTLIRVYGMSEAEYKEAVAI